MHIAIEGLDGVGKTTVAKLAADILDFQFVEKPLHYLFKNQDKVAFRHVALEIKSTGDNTMKTFFYGTSNYFASLLSHKQSIVADRHLVSTWFWNYDGTNQAYFDYLVNVCGCPEKTFLLYAEEKIRKERLMERDPYDKDLQVVFDTEMAMEKMTAFTKHYHMPYQIIDTSHMAAEEVAEQITEQVRLFK